MKSLALLALAACGAPQPAAPVPAPHADPEAVATAALDAYDNTSPLVTGDGHVVFISSRDGLPQLYVGEVAKPDAPPEHLPTPKERVTSPWLTPDERTVIFLSDVGTDQKFHIFRIDIDGTFLTDMTPDGDWRRDSLHVSRGSGTMFYVAHTMTDQTSVVFEQKILGAPREVYRDPRVGVVADVTADGWRLLFVEALSDVDGVVLAIDTHTGIATRLYPPEGKHAAIGDVAFSADGRAAIVGTQERDQPAHVKLLDASSGAEVGEYVETAAPNASISTIIASPADDRIAVALDAGDHAELRMLDAKLKPLPAPKLPLGSFGLSAFTSNGKQLGLSIRDASGPTDIFALDGTELVPLRHEPRSGLGTPPRATIEHLRAFDGATIPVNLYLPPNAAHAPTLVLVHGGPSGSARIGWSPSIAFWTAMGFAVIAPNIRGSSGFGIAYQDADNLDKRGDALRDMETINRWARAQPWCDPDRIVIAGISYGGYMTLLALGHQPTLWRAGIDGSGMSNLTTMERLEDQTIRSFDDSEFGVLGKDDALLAKWSPITAVDKIVAPVFVYQGVRDPVTPQGEADQIVEALHTRHIPVEYMLVANEGHSVTRRENVIAYLVRSYRFVTAHMQ